MSNISNLVNIGRAKMGLALGAATLIATAGVAPASVSFVGVNTEAMLTGNNTTAVVTRLNRL